MISFPALSFRSSDKTMAYLPGLGLCLLMLVALLMSAAPAHAQQRSEDTTIEGFDARSQALWNRNWQLAAKNYILFNGEFVCIRGFNERYPSSRGVRVADLMSRDKGKIVRVRNRRGFTVEYRVVLSRPEAEAQAMALPEMAVGQYGYIHSVEVERILSPDAMVVRNVWLIDPQAVKRSQDDERSRLNQEYDWRVANELAEALFVHRNNLQNIQQQAVFSREFVLRGYPTDSLSSGMRWSGPREGELQIALLTVQDIDDNWSADRGKRRMLVAIPVNRLRNGLNHEQFLALLTQRQIKPQDLITVIQDANRSVMRDIEKSLVDAIEARAKPASTEE
jgi:hypothetical protein